MVGQTDSEKRPLIEMLNAYSTTIIPSSARAKEKRFLPLRFCSSGATRVTSRWNTWVELRFKLIN